jgi:hypothetical protein
VYVEQRLTTCEVCCRTLALQYQWDAGRPPTISCDTVFGRAFACPACGHLNPFATLMYAHDFELKLVPGPEPAAPRVHPNTLRRVGPGVCAALAPHPRLPPSVTPQCEVPPAGMGADLGFWLAMWPVLLCLLHELLRH